MNIKNICMLVGVTLASLLINGCAQNVSPNTYQGYEVGVASRVVPGVIIAKRPVNIDNNSGAGGVAGAVAGAAAGSAVGGSTAGNIVGAVGGAVVGGVAGNAIDASINHHVGFEYIVRLQKGRIISIVQDQSAEFHVHQHILVLYGDMTRIIADTTSNG